MGLAAVAAVAGAGDADVNPFTPALAGGPSATGDTFTDTRFGPVNIGGVFDSPAGQKVGLLVPLLIGAVILAVLIFRR